MASSPMNTLLRVFDDWPVRLWPLRDQLEKCGCNDQSLLDPIFYGMSSPATTTTTISGLPSSLSSMIEHVRSNLLLKLLNEAVSSVFARELLLTEARGRLLAYHPMPEMRWPRPTNRQRWSEKTSTSSFKRWRSLPDRASSSTLLRVPRIIQAYIVSFLGIHGMLRLASCCRDLSYDPLFTEAVAQQGCVHPVYSRLGNDRERQPLRSLLHLQPRALRLCYEVDAPLKPGNEVEETVRELANFARLEELHLRLYGNHLSERHWVQLLVASPIRRIDLTIEVISYDQQEASVVTDLCRQVEPLAAKLTGLNIRLPGPLVPWWPVIDGTSIPTEFIDGINRFSSLRRLQLNTAISPAMFMAVANRPLLRSIACERILPDSHWRRTSEPDPQLPVAVDESEFIGIDLLHRPFLRTISMASIIPELLRPLFASSNWNITDLQLTSHEVFPIAASLVQSSATTQRLWWIDTVCHLHRLESLGIIRAGLSDCDIQSLLRFGPISPTMSGHRFPYLHTLNLSGNPISQIADDLIRPFATTLTRLDLSKTSIRVPRDIRIKLPLLRQLDLNHTDFTPDLKFVVQCGAAVVDLSGSRRSHRTVHNLIAELRKQPKKAHLVAWMENNFRVENVPARPGSDDDLGTDGWSTEF